ncbi:MAG: hypothetical protein ACE5IL_12245 [Myxococcota bacterium]
MASPPTLGHRTPSRFACLWIPDPALTAVLRAEPQLAGRSIAVAEEDDPRAAVMGGALRGLSVAQARTARPDLVVRRISLEGIRSAQEALVDVARSITPRVEDSAAGIVLLDLEGTEVSFPTPGRLRAALDQRLAEVGLGPGDVTPARRGTGDEGRTRVGIGPSRTVALLAARHRGGGHAVTTGEVGRFLRDLPLDLLEPPDELFDRLTRWGVRTLGALASLPLRALGARLGEEGVQLARRARGEDLLPFRPAPPRQRFEEGLETGYPVGDLERLAFLVRGALERLARRLRLLGLAVRELRVELELENGETFARRVGLGAPTHEGATLTRLVRLALEADPPRAPVERLRVIATPSLLEPSQLDLFLPPLPAPAELASTVARLEAMCGPGQVGAPALEEGYRPDAARIADFDTHPAPQPAPRLGPPSTPAMALRALRPPQPLRVWGPCEAPERVEPRGKWNTPGEIAGGHVVERAGPWRLFGEWWGERCYARDYYDVELSDGGLYRIYRGLDDGGWWMDGIYD